MFQVLALSGSLREASVNSAFCRAVARLSPPPVQVTPYGALGELPLFNPDLEARLPAAVRDLRARVTGADALLIASPEYAHGISGPLKNALDWLVSHEGTVGKPVAAVRTSSRAIHADQALREVLRTMAFELVDEACACIPLPGHTTESSMIADPAVRAAVAAMVERLQEHLARQARHGGSRLGRSRAGSPSVPGAGPR